MSLKSKHFDKIYRKFDVSISEKYDCGRMCAPLNEGEPVCCSTEHAIPVVDNAEWQLLRKRTDMWTKFKPFDKSSREVVAELADNCRAIECKGAANCERQNRTIACRAFPFFPYFTKQAEIIGVSHYWTFADRCWVTSNMQIVEQEFIDELISVYEFIFARDEGELDAYKDQSASMRRVFSRKNKPIPILGRDGKVYKVPPKSGGKVVRAKLSEFKPNKTFRDDKSYRKAIRDWGGEPKGKTLDPDWSVKDWWNHT